jgi:hypothetical protein
LQETRKFFKRNRLSAIPWTQENWKNRCQDKSVLWIVKLSLLAEHSPFRRLVQSEFSSNFNVISTWSDEGHLYGRSEDSFQNNFLRSICARSQFNVLISGTIFPLSPSTDAGPLLRTLGGPFDGSGDGGQWRRNLRLAFNGLFPRRLKSEEDILVLRTLIAPFTLRRTMTSVWDGVWIIKRHVTRPVIAIVKPPADEIIARKARKKFNLESPDPQTEYQIIKRADHQRLYAWSPSCYMEYLRLKNTSSCTSQKRVDLMCKAVAAKIHDSTLTGRVKRVVAAAKYYEGRGERFIIVCERLFPLVLLYYVRSLSNYPDVDRFAKSSSD